MAMIIVHVADHFVLEKPDNDMNGEHCSAEAACLTLGLLNKL